MNKKNLLTSLALTLSLTVLAPFASIAKAETQSQPNIVGKAAITMDIDTGEIIYAKNVDNQMYPASVTKLMTGLLLAENKQKNDKLAYTADAKKQPEYSFNLNVKPMAVGETMSADDVMKTLLLFSANDFAYMISDNIAGNSQKFSDMMNAKAKDLHMNNTHFITPNGLHDKNHYTTAFDLALLGKASYENPWVRETINLKKERVTTSAGTIAFVENRNKNTGIEGSLGGKTGYTSDAGRCLLELYERNGKKIVGVVLKSAYDAQDAQVFSDMKDIINWSYSANKVTAYKKDTVIKTIPVKYKVFKFFGPEKIISVPLKLKDDVTYYDNYVNKESYSNGKNSIEIDTNNLNPWKFSKGQTITKLSFKEKVASKDCDLYTDVTSSDLVKANVGTYILSVISLVVFVLVLCFILLLIKKSGRRRRRKKDIF